MANREHVEIVKNGAAEIAAWRDSNQHEVLDLTGAYLLTANLSGANLSKSLLRKANLEGANVSMADFRKADLSGVNFLGAYVAEANLAGADLSKAIFRQTILRNAKLTGANLSGAYFWRANLAGADLSEAFLRETDFSAADLGDANLSKAELSRVDLSGAYLSGCTCGFTSFSDIDFSCAIGLDGVRHIGPSTVGIDSMYASRGKIPESFLRGCGVPESLITMIPSLIGALEPIQYYSCFISYSGKDDEFARRLHGRLQQENLRVWFAPEEMKGGRKIHEQIESAIRVHDKLLLVLSKESMGSEWVKTEIYHARQRQVQEKRQVLFPISLVPFEEIRQWTAFDSDSGKDMAREIREYHIPDFSNWKEYDAFEKSFRRLINDLRLNVNQ